MVRIYLRFIIDILDKLNAAYCWQAYDLISELCSETNVDFFLMSCLINCIIQKIINLFGFFSEQIA